MEKIVKIRQMVLSEFLQIKKKIKQSEKVKKIVSHLCVPRIGFLLFLVMSICFSFVVIVEHLTNEVVIFSFLILLLIVIGISFVLMKIKENEKQVLIGIGLIAFTILSFSNAYKPYTFQLKVLVEMLLFVFALLFFIHSKQKYWILGIICLFGQILDSRFVFLFLLPLIGLSYYLDKYFSKWNDFRKVYLVIFLVSFLIILFRIFLLKKIEFSLFYKSSESFYYPCNNIKLMLIAFLIMLFLKNISGYKEKVLCGLGTLLMMFLQGGTNDGYLYGEILIFSLLIIHIPDFIKNKKINLCSKLEFLVMWGILIWLKYFMELHLESSLWNTRYAISHYYVEYIHYGFVQRGLAGTLIYLLFGFSIPAEQMNLIVDIFYFMALNIVFIILYQFVKKTDNKNRVVVFYLVAIMFISPALGGYMYKLTVQSIDVYGLLCMMLCVYLLYKEKCIFGVPVLCVIGMLNHQIFVFIFFPMIFSMLIYRTFIDGKKSKKYYVCMLFLTCTITFGLFLFIQFYSSKFLRIDLNTALNLLDQRAGKNEIIKSVLFDSVIFSSVKDHVAKFQGQITVGMVKNMIKTIFYCIPLEGLYGYAYYKSIKHESVKVRKIAYIFMCVSIFAFLPCYILETDYYRWTTNLLFTFILSILMLTVIQPKEKRWFEDLNVEILQIWLLTIAVILGLYVDRPFSVY